MLLWRPTCSGGGRSRSASSPGSIQGNSRLSRGGIGGTLGMPSKEDAVEGWIPLIVVASTVFVSVTIAACRKGRFGHFLIPVIGGPVTALVLTSPADANDTMGLGPILAGAFVGAVVLAAWLSALIVDAVRAPRPGSAAAKAAAARRRRRLPFCPRCGTHNAGRRLCMSCGTWLVRQVGSDQTLAV